MYIYICISIIISLSIYLYMLTPPSRTYMFICDLLNMLIHYTQTRQTVHIDM